MAHSGGAGKNSGGRENMKLINQQPEVALRTLDLYARSKAESPGWGSVAHWIGGGLVQPGRAWATRVEERLVVVTHYKFHRALWVQGVWIDGAVLAMNSERTSGVFLPIHHGDLAIAAKAAVDGLKGGGREGHPISHAGARFPARNTAVGDPGSCGSPTCR